MKITKLILTFLTALFATSVFAKVAIIEPKTHTDNGIAITVDMCDGKTDEELLNVLIKTNTKATLFVTSKWITKNKDAINIINSHPELFRVENHGYRHLAALIDTKSTYKLKAVKNEEDLNEEIFKANEDIIHSFPNLNKPSYYRTAGAQYDSRTESIIKSSDYKIGGYTIAADGGAKYPSKVTLLKLFSAKEGDVILIHGNHPESGNAKALSTYLNNQSSKNFVWLN